MQDVLSPLFGKQSLTFPNNPIRCLQITAGNSVGRQSLFTNQERYAEATRAVELSKIGNIQLVMGRAHRDKAWQALAPSTLNADEEISVWSKKLETIIQQTPKHECGALLVQLAERCLAANDWQRWSVIVERASALLPLSDCSRFASLIQLRMLASEEFLAWQAQSQAAHGQDPEEGANVAGQLVSAPGIKHLKNPLASTPFDGPGEVQPAVATKNQQPTSVVQTVSREQPLSTMDSVRIGALKRAISEFNRLSEADRALASRPDVWLAHYSRRRTLSELAGEPAPDAGALQVISGRGFQAGWPQVAAQEFVMAGGRAERTGWMARAHRAAEAPELNGRDDDACWQTATVIELINPFLPPVVSNQSDRLATRVKFAYDDEFLYGHIACPNVTGAASAKSRKEARRYDMNLDGTDHVVLSLDTDRDYTSANQLAINRSGHTFDRCCEHSAWNPRWHVDVDETGSTWSTEFAIRLSDLTTRSPQPGQAWAISAFRYVPGWGVQSWSHLRSQTPHLQGNGLLMFE